MELGLRGHRRREVHRRHGQANRALQDDPARKGTGGPTLNYVGTVAYPTIGGNAAVATFGQTIPYQYTLKTRAT